MKKAAWIPSDAYQASTRLGQWMKSLGFCTYDELYQKSIDDIAWFWGEAARAIGFQWLQPYKEVVDVRKGMAFPSWYVDGTCNVVDSALHRWTKNTITKTKTALIWEGENESSDTLTYEELENKINCVANGLLQHGIQKGDRITIYMPMIPETVIAMLAAMKIGAIVSPVFSGFAAAAVAVRVQAAQSKMLITVDGFMRRGRLISLKYEADQVCIQCPTVEKVVVVSYARNDHVSKAYDVRWDELTSAAPLSSSVEMKSDDPLMLLYTSGTTGMPKGTVHTHAGFPLKAAVDAAFGMNIGRESRLFWVTDMGWMMGPFLVFATLMNGATMMLYDGAIDAPAPDRLWSLIDRHKLTHVGISPTLIRTLKAVGNDLVEKHSLESLEVIGSTGEPWDEESWLWLFQTVGRGHVPIWNYSGGTEIAGGILANVLVKPIFPAAFNAALPGMAAVVLDEKGNTVTNEVGELCLQKPWVGMTKSFWGDDDRYIKAYWSRYANTWLHGDWVKYDGEQYVITGRSDDTINVAGKRIGPTEYEAVLAKHPYVVEAAAIGVPHAIKGEVSYCFVVIEEGIAYTEEVKQELVVLLKQHIGKALCPENIYGVAALPKTRNAKVMRRIIKSAFLGEQLGDVSALVNPEAVIEIQSLRS